MQWLYTRTSYIAMVQVSHLSILVSLVKTSTIIMNLDSRGLCIHIAVVSDQRNSRGYTVYTSLGPYLVIISFSSTARIHFRLPHGKPLFTLCMLRRTCDTKLSLSVVSLANYCSGFYFQLFFKLL